MAQDLDALGFTPLEESRGDTQYAIVRVNLGDGYSQRAVDGINAKRETWTVAFHETIANINSIVSLLDTAAGSEVISWTPPREASAKKWSCEQYSRAYGVLHDKLTLVLVREYDL